MTRRAGPLGGAASKGKGCRLQGTRRRAGRNASCHAALSEQDDRRVGSETRPGTPGTQVGAPKAAPLLPLRQSLGRQRHRRATYYGANLARGAFAPMRPEWVRSAKSEWADVMIVSLRNLASAPTPPSNAAWACPRNRAIDPLKLGRRAVEESRSPMRDSLPHLMITDWPNAGPTVRHHRLSTSDPSRCPVAHSPSGGAGFRR